ncbi:hypothetical protein FI667_g9207, partial [Globisporangium splendens]
MYSLDVVLWKGKRSEKEAAMKKAKQQSAYGSALPRVTQDKKIKQIYGKTTKEMYESYLSRVEHWMQDAPSQNWTKEYDKETYSRAYVPRERQKEKDIGGPAVKIGSYSPRGVYKGGGKCVRQLVDPKAIDANALPRESYKERIINFEKTREKHKKLHPPMSIPKNKPLTCGKYFVSDVVCCSSQDDDHQEHGHGSSNQQHGSGCRRCAAHCCSSSSPEHQEEDHDEVKEREDVAVKHYLRHIHSCVGHGDDKEPQPTAEYVASPKWRVHEPHKWMSRDFSTTIAPTNTHTATRVSISGTPYKPSLLIAERFTPTNRNVTTATSPLVIAFVAFLLFVGARAKGKDCGSNRAAIPTARAKEILQLDVDGAHRWSKVSSLTGSAIAKSATRRPRPRAQSTWTTEIPTKVAISWIYATTFSMKQRLLQQT